MERSTILALVLRVLQFIFAAVVLGLSVKEYKFLGEVKKECNAQYKSSECNFNGFYPAIGFAAFTGAWTLVTTAVGLTSAFVDFIPWLVVLVLEVLTAIFTLAGGIRAAVLNSQQPFLCHWLGACYYFRTDAAFLLLGFIASAVALVMIFVVQRRSGGKTRSVV